MHYDPALVRRPWPPMLPVAVFVLPSPRTDSEPWGRFKITST